MEQAAVNIRQIYDALLRRSFSDEEKIFIENFIVKHQLTEFVSDSISKIEILAELSNSGKTVNIDEIKTIAYLALKKPNSAIATITDPLEKKKVKYLLSKLGRIIQSEISQRTNKHPELIKAIDEGLDQAVHTEQYDVSDFNQHFPTLDLNIKDSKISIENNKPRKEYLEWNHDHADLNKCVELLTDEYFCIRSSNNFKSLFDDPYNQCILKCKPEKINLILLLFDRLWTDELIILKGGKGIWTLLEGRFRDFDNNPFPFKFAKRLNKIKSDVKSDSVIFRELQQILESVKK